MCALLLRERDVEQLLDVRRAIDLLDDAFRRWDAGEAVNVPRDRAVVSGFALHTMSAAVPYLGVAGWKAYSTTKNGARFLVGLYDLASGQLLSLLEADLLGQIRTGATTGVAISHLALADAAEVGVFGAGWQAESQLAAACVARGIKRAFVYSRNDERRTEFCARMSQRLDIEVVPVDRPQEAASELPIVITATTSREPVFDGKDLAEGTLVCAVGANWQSRAEIDADVVRLADNVVCDSVEACRHEAGDFRSALERGLFDWKRAVDLAAVVSGQAVGRRTRDSIVLFKSVGLAIEDVVVAAWCYRRALETGQGTELPI
ncbi:MAG: ornithine cyclodeaminase family protein [Pirellulales bacterium]|nr:ornithine cyclodeaminase family protein [Pirellulales bacterium]